HPAAARLEPQRRPRYHHGDPQPRHRGRDRPRGPAGRGPGRRGRAREPVPGLREQPCLGPAARAAGLSHQGPIMPAKVYINGKIYDKADAKISVYDHGLLYGDGVFEGIRVYSGKIFRLRAHVERLFESARAIKLEIPLSREQMMEAIAATVK